MNAPLKVLVTGRLIAYGGLGLDDLLAFDLVTREWTVPLAPSEGRPTPSPYS